MKCFYHSADLDGHCSGAIIKRRFPECEMLGINYGDDFPWELVVLGEKVFMVDFTLQPFVDMERLNAVCELHWIDHHKTAIEEAHKRGFLASGQLLKVGEAGCELTWIYIHGDEPLPTAIYLLGRYDVWDHCNDMVLPFQYGMRQFTDTTPLNQVFWEPLLASEVAWQDIVDDGRVLLAYEKAQNEKFCRAYAFETELNGMKAVCANCGFGNSQIFESIYNPGEHHLMITFVRIPAGKWTVSLYSTHPDVDCGALAKSFGGGGHKSAAGFQCDELPFTI